MWSGKIGIFYGNTIWSLLILKAYFSFRLFVHAEAVMASTPCHFTLEPKTTVGAILNVMGPHRKQVSQQDQTGNEILQPRKRVAQIS